MLNIFDIRLSETVSSKKASTHKLFKRLFLKKSKWKVTTMKSSFGNCPKINRSRKYHKRLIQLFNIQPKIVPKTQCYEWVCVKIKITHLESYPKSFTTISTHYIQKYSEKLYKEIIRDHLKFIPDIIFNFILTESYKTIFNSLVLIYFHICVNYFVKEFNIIFEAKHYSFFKRHNPSQKYKTVNIILPDCNFKPFSCLFKYEEKNPKARYSIIKQNLVNCNCNNNYEDFEVKEKASFIHPPIRKVNLIDRIYRQILSKPLNYTKKIEMMDKYLLFCSIFQKLFDQAGDELLDLAIVDGNALSQERKYQDMSLRGEIVFITSSQKMTSSQKKKRDKHPMITLNKSNILIKPTDYSLTYNFATVEPLTINERAYKPIIGQTCLNYVGWHDIAFVLSVYFEESKALLTSDYSIHIKNVGVKDAIDQQSSQLSQCLSIGDISTKDGESNTDTIILNDRRKVLSRKLLNINSKKSSSRIPKQKFNGGLQLNKIGKSYKSILTENNDYNKTKINSLKFNERGGQFTLKKDI